MPPADSSPLLLDQVVPGQRVTLRRREDDGFHDVIGFVTSIDTDLISVVDRRGEPHHWERSAIVAVRLLGPPLGRNPLRTSRAELERLAAAAGGGGRLFVVRLSTLLDGLVPPADPPDPGSVHLAGEWACAQGWADLPGVGWWAIRHDARNLLVWTTRTESPPAGLGLSER